MCLHCVCVCSWSSLCACDIRLFFVCVHEFVFLNQFCGFCGCIGSCLVWFVGRTKRRVVTLLIASCGGRWPRVTVCLFPLERRSPFVRVAGSVRRILLSNRLWLSPNTFPCATSRPEVAVAYDKRVRFTCLSGLATNPKDAELMKILCFQTSEHNSRTSAGLDTQLNAKEVHTGPLRSFTFRCRVCRKIRTNSWYRAQGAFIPSGATSERFIMVMCHLRRSWYRGSLDTNTKEKTKNQT